MSKVCKAIVGEIKHGRIARSGIQIYSRAEVLARGIKPKIDKEFYKEYRPASVLLEHRDSFRYTPFINDHTEEDITPDNFRKYIVGVAGGNVDVEVIDDEVYLTNDVVFYDKKAYDDYAGGKRELSSGYDTIFAPVDNPEEVGYDFIMLDIPAVNHLALCDKARAGREARITDNASKDVEILNDGGEGMNVIRKGLLGFLGIGKNKDSAEPFSKVLFGTLDRAKALDSADLEALRSTTVTDSVMCFGASEAREVLAGVVHDSFDNIDAVLGSKKDEVAKVVDSLYTQCRDADKAEFDRITSKAADSGAVPPKDTKKDEDDKKGDKKEGDEDDEKAMSAKNKDAIASIISEQLTAAIPTIVAKVSDAMDAKVQDSVNTALGIDPKGPKGAKARDSREAVDSASDINIDGLFEPGAR